MKMNYKRTSAQKTEAREWVWRRRKEDPVFTVDFQGGRQEKWLYLSFKHYSSKLLLAYRPLPILSAVHLLKNKKKLFLLSKTRKDTHSEWNVNDNPKIREMRDSVWVDCFLFCRGSILGPGLREPILIEKNICQRFSSRKPNHSRLGFFTLIKPRYVYDKT